MTARITVLHRAHMIATAVNLVSRITRRAYSTLCDCLSAMLLSWKRLLSLIPSPRDSSEIRRDTVFARHSCRDPPGKRSEMGPRRGRQHVRHGKAANYNRKWSIDDVSYCLLTRRGPRLYSE